MLAPFAGKSLYKNQGQRVVEGQRLMQATSDIFLGWVRITGMDGIEHDYYVRQLWDAKGSVDPAVMLPEGFEVYARMCGWTLARAHARSGDRVAIGAYLGKKDTFDQAIADFSEAYADQNERDHAGAGRGGQEREDHGGAGGVAARSRRWSVDGPGRWRPVGSTASLRPLGCDTVGGIADRPAARSSR